MSEDKPWNLFGKPGRAHRIGKLRMPAESPDYYIDIKPIPPSIHDLGAFFPIAELHPYMNDHQSALLRHIRRLVAEKREHLALFEDREIRLFHNQVDVTPEHRKLLLRQLEELEKLIAEHDPHGLTADEKASG